MNYLEPQLPQQEVSALGNECDNKGDHGRRWGLLPQSSEVWMGETWSKEMLSLM